MLFKYGMRERLSIRSRIPSSYIEKGDPVVSMKRPNISSRQFGKQFKRDWEFHLFLLIPVIYIVIFEYLPMYGVQIAFRDFDPILGVSGSKWVGFEHFRKFFASYQFSNIVSNTLRISLYSLAIEFPLPIIFALMLNIFKNIRYKKLVQTITYMPHFISTVVIVGLLIQLLSPINGLYGNIFRLFANGMYPTDILGKPRAFIHLYVWSGIWQSLGWSSIIYISALSAISPELSEAAQIDGASRWQRIWHVDFPGILPTIAIMLILNAGSIMSVGFEKVFLMQNKMNLEYSEVIATYVYKTGMTIGANNYSYASAIGLFNNVINCLMLLIVNSLSKKFSADNTSLW